MVEAPTTTGERGFSPPWLSRAERVTSLVIAVGALSLLLVAARLEPSPYGFGTHTQLGLPACSWPSIFNIPCSACGMTTAFSHAARGDMLSAFLTQPFGAVLAMATALAVVVGAFAAITGTRVISFFTPLLSKWGAFVAIALLLAAWAYKTLQFKGLLG